MPFAISDSSSSNRLHEQIKYGPLSDKILTRETVDEVVTDYYRTQGWDEQTGVPTPETLKSYGLDDPAYAKSVAAVTA